MTFRCGWCRHEHDADYARKWKIRIAVGRGINEYCPNCFRVKPQWRIA